MRDNFCFHYTKKQDGFSFFPCDFSVVIPLTPKLHKHGIVYTIQLLLQGTHSDSKMWMLKIVLTQALNYVWTPTGRTYLPNFAHKNPLLKNSLLQFWISANWTQAMHWLFLCRSFAWTPKRNPQYLEHQRQQQHYQLQHKHQQNERHDNLSCYIQQPTPHHSSSQKKVRLIVSSSDNVACLDFRGHRGLLCLRYSPTKSSDGSSLKAAKRDSLAKIIVFLWFFAWN